MDGQPAGGAGAPTVRFSRSGIRRRPRAAMTGVLAAQGRAFRTAVLTADPEALSQMRVPEGETVVEVLKRLMKYLPPEELHAKGHG